MPMTMVSRRALLGAAALLLAPRAAGAATLLTPRQTEGPFYPTEIPADDDSDLVKIEGAVREAGGDILHLAGRALDGNGRPLPDLTIEIWQCDSTGAYLHRRSRGYRDRDTGFQGFGRARTGADGGFAFRTIVPVPYPGRTPHIHAKVLDGGREVLTTQLYRAGYPQNGSDGLFRRLSPAEQERVSMVLAPRVDADRATFDAAVELVLAG